MIYSSHNLHPPSSLSPTEFFKGFFFYIHIGGERCRRHRHVDTRAACLHPLIASGRPSQIWRASENHLSILDKHHLNQQCGHPYPSVWIVSSNCASQTLEASSFPFHLRHYYLRDASIPTGTWCHNLFGTVDGIGRCPTRPTHLCQRPSTGWKRKS